MASATCFPPLLLSNSSTLPGLITRVPVTITGCTALGPSGGAHVRGWGADKHTASGAADQGTRAFGRVWSTPPEGSLSTPTRPATC
ncbi:hypothetical protein H8959_007756, partial [Pygathrix nigripes]